MRTSKPSRAPAQDVHTHLVLWQLGREQAPRRLSVVLDARQPAQLHDVGVQGSIHL